MALNVPVSAEVEAKLRAKASAAGIAIETFAARQLERVALSSDGAFEELTDAAYQEFLASGMTDDELGDFLEREKHAMRAERRRRSAS